MSNPVKTDDAARILELAKGDWPQQSQAIDLLMQWEPIDIAIFAHEHPEAEAELSYLIATGCEGLMFEVAHLEAVLGPSIHDAVTNFGLDEQQIAEYQQIWRDRGIEPTTYQWPRSDGDPEEVPDGVN